MLYYQPKLVLNLQPQNSYLTVFSSSKLLYHNPYSNVLKP